ncbi:MAG: deoxyguanosinetriphosphate triphosphohydrolase, partial [Thauera phenolivorans]|nr:deoxyguanosinetriphosphate triphosphohydrolase [Thauera phenolivorans]
FGHAGQEALNACMKDYGGFEHNLQSLRTVDLLEEHYAAFDGLNLMFETREGILKHCARTNAVHLGELGQRFLDGTQPSIEAQLANLADEIAYNNHDVDDGLRSGLITLEQLEAVPIFADNRREVEARWPGLGGRRLIHETIRRMIHLMVIDLLGQTRANIAAAGVETLADVHAAPRLAAYSDALLPRLQVLKRFLHENLYRHYQVLRMTNKARRIVTELFAAFMDDPRLLPPQYQAKAREDKPRVIADYIAGMTDRYAIREHRRLFAVGEIH